MRRGYGGGGGGGRGSTARRPTDDIGPPQVVTRIVAGSACRLRCSHRSQYSRGAWPSVWPPEHRYPPSGVHSVHTVHSSRDLTVMLVAGPSVSEGGVHTDHGVHSLTSRRDER